MLDNHIYNLFSTITEESRELWRLKHIYKEDAVNCENCKKLCAELVEDKEKHLEKLEEAFKKHL